MGYYGLLLVGYNNNNFNGKFKLKLITINHL